MRRILLLVAATVIGACGVFSGAEPSNVASPDGGDGDGDGGADGGDGAVVGVGKAPDSGDAASKVSVIARGDFESTNCLGWSVNGATLDSHPVAHSGSYSCRVCDESGGTASPVWGAFQVARTIAPGVYVARAFARTSGDAGPFEVWLGLQATDGADQGIGSLIERKVTIAPGEDWAPATVKLVVEAGQGAAVLVLSRTGGGCFLVDDVELVKE